MVSLPSRWGVQLAILHRGYDSNWTFPGLVKPGVIPRPLRIYNKLGAILGPLT